MALDVSGTGRKWIGTFSSSACSGAGGQSLCSLFLTPAACVPGLRGLHPPGLSALALSVLLSVCPLADGKQAAALGEGDVSLRTGEWDRKVAGFSWEGECPELTLGVALEGAAGSTDSATELGSGSTSQGS